jgi:hypothetical protein
VTISDGVYKRYGHILYRRSAFLIEGKVEQDRRRAFSFLAERISDLHGALTGKAEIRVPEPRAVASSRAFVQASMQLVMERKIKRFGTYEEAPTDHFPINENHKTADGNHFATVAFYLTEEGKINM